MKILITSFRGVYSLLGCRYQKRKGIIKTMIERPNQTKRIGLKFPGNRNLPAISATTAQAAINARRLIRRKSGRGFIWKSGSWFISTPSAWSPAPNNQPALRSRGVTKKLIRSTSYYCGLLLIMRGSKQPKPEWPDKRLFVQISWRFYASVWGNQAIGRRGTGAVW